MKGVIAALVLFLADSVGVAAPRSESASKIADEIAKGYYTEVRPVLDQISASALARLGPDSAETLSAQADLGALMVQQGQYREADALLATALGHAETALAEDDPVRFKVMHAVSLLVREEQPLEFHGRPLYALANDALEGRRRTLGAEHPDTLASTETMAVLAAQFGSLIAGLSPPDALFESGLATSERILGSQNPLTLLYETDLGAYRRKQGRFNEAEALLDRALKGREALFGPVHPDSLRVMLELAALRADQDRLEEAERLLRSGLISAERALGPQHPLTLRFVGSMAVLYRQEGRLDEARPLFERAVQVGGDVLGPLHPFTLAMTSGVSELYLSTGEDDRAEPLLVGAAKAVEETRVIDPRVGIDILFNLGTLEMRQGKTKQAEAHLSSFVLTTMLDGYQNPAALQRANIVARFMIEAGDQSGAKEFTRLNYLDMVTRLLGPTHPVTLQAAYNATLYRLRFPVATEPALDTARPLIANLRNVPKSGGPNGDAGGALRFQSLSNDANTLFADAAWMAIGSKEAGPDALRGEAFVALQQAMTDPASQSIARMAARRYAESASVGLGALVEERERQEQLWSGNAQAFAASFSDTSDGVAARRAVLDRERASIAARTSAIDAELRQKFPDYFSFVRPAPLALADAQHLLAKDEALLMLVPGRFGTHVFALSRDKAAWIRAELDSTRVDAAVERLRWDAGANVPPSFAQEFEDLPVPSGPPAFDRTTAFMLYQKLIAPVLPVLQGKTLLHIVAGGPLAGIPFSILVSAPPTGADNDPVALRNTAWLADRFALVHVPSIRSFELVRGVQNAASTKPAAFLGIGDPALDGVAAKRGLQRGAPYQDAARILSTGVTRSSGVIANVAKLRQLARLPGTAVELRAMGTALRAPPDSLLLGAKAIESTLRSSDLTGASIIAFATHGLTAGEIWGYAEPGLVLTPPQHASDQDDGYLAASEISALRLRADWVILSACNTAAGDTSDSHGLGSLARAFLFAGVQNLLASHWPVSDEVAPRLTVRTLELQNGGMPRAKALQVAMREIRTDTAHDMNQESWAHPFYWAPFVLIGDGAN